MAKDGHVSMKANFEHKSAAIRKSNEVAYKTKDGSDSDEVSHGSRPSQVNSPDRSVKKA